ncbi:hypothetical protein CEXT_573391 [Caerostris extrusa]|uniref:Maturase K n=1 Tax=Caerostris extrusa TaxID=172846 RepID=A0AAV4XUM8_CAEEX|nr:hypothetical protein CEXT_573391 [Caerostris extrusa]
MDAREPIKDQKQLHQKTGRSDISNYFPGTSPADLVYQIVFEGYLIHVIVVEGFMKKYGNPTPRRYGCEAHQSPKTAAIKRREDLIFQTIFLLHLRQILSIRSLYRNRERLFYFDIFPPFCSYFPQFFLRRNLAANPKGNKTYLGTQLRGRYGCERARKQLHQKTEDLIFQTIFPATSPADPVYQIFSYPFYRLFYFDLSPTIFLLPPEITKKKEPNSEKMWLVREPHQSPKTAASKDGRSDISNYFPATSPADPVYQIVRPE